MNLLQKTYWVLKTQIGIDPLILWRSIRAIPAFFKDYSAFSSAYKGNVAFMPCLQDRNDDCGSMNNEYFWQDLLVARMILKEKPSRHLDIGSRIDGFVAHVAVCRDIEVLDIRPNPFSIPGIIFRQADLMAPIAELREAYDSVSCLHALEHFGLGRYGDRVDPEGYRSGLRNMAAFIKPGGLFYLSTPVGRERVEFNANWIFNAVELAGLAEACSLEFIEMTRIRSGSKGCEIDKLDRNQLNKVSEEDYSLGIFLFKKK